MNHSIAHVPQQVVVHDVVIECAISFGIVALAKNGNAASDQRSDDATE